MNALAYLRTMPAVFISVPASTDKQYRFAQNVKPHLREVYMQPAAPIVDARAEAFAWRDLIVNSKESMDPKGHYERVKVFCAKDKTLEQPKKQHEYAATYSLYRSVQAALSFGLLMGWDRFMVFEDDAMPRLDLLKQVGAPPQGDLNVWGGAMKMGAHKADDRRYMAGESTSWKRITSSYDRYIATAYEVSADGASSYLRSLKNHPHAVDCAWWYTMDEVPSYRLDLAGFVQVGRSDRIASREIIREGAYVRV